MASRTPILLALLLGTLLGLSLGLGLGQRLLGPPYLKVDPVARAWVDYRASIAAMVAGTHTPSPDDPLIQVNDRAWGDLVRRGEIVAIRYPWQDTALRDVIGSLQVAGVEDLRHGFALLGGQWPPGVIHVRKDQAATVRQALAAIAP